MADAAYGSLLFREQAEFFRRKINLPTTSWTDIYTQEHDWAFVVAGANRDDIVTDFRAAVEKAISDGTTLEEFRRDFDRIVARYGWDYNGGRDWRSRVIYDTNLATSYAAGRWEQLQEAPYWQYEHSDWVEHPRLLHVSWDGLVLERGNTWWRTHFPPNGWGCQCKVRGLWRFDLERLGKTGPDPTPGITWVDQTIGQRSPLGPRTVSVPEGIDPGFEYAPGASRLTGAIPPERPSGPRGGGADPISIPGQGLPNRQPTDALPPARPAPSETILPQGLAPENYVDTFLQPLGATLEQPAIVRDVVGERLVVGKELFTDAQGAWTILQTGREQFLPLLALALMEPDEVWVSMEWLSALSKAVVRRRYIARFLVQGQDMPALVVFETGTDGWDGTVAFQVATPEYLDSVRMGVRLYRRDDEQ